MRQCRKIKIHVNSMCSIQKYSESIPDFIYFLKKNSHGTQWLIGADSCRFARANQELSELVVKQRHHSKLNNVDEQLNYITKVRNNVNGQLNDITMVRNIKIYCILIIIPHFNNIYVLEVSYICCICRVESCVTKAAVSFFPTPCSVMPH